MSLTVHAYKYNENGVMEFLEVPLGRDLAGFESSRENFWGADIMKTLGLTLLTSLREQNIHAEGQELDKLEAEIRVIQKNVDLILESVDYDKSFVEERTRNVLEAIKSAKENHGGVTIW